MANGARSEHHPSRQVGRERFVPPSPNGESSFPPGVTREGVWGNPRMIVRNMDENSSQGTINAAYDAIRQTTDLTGTEANQIIRDATQGWNPNGSIQASVGPAPGPLQPLQHFPGTGEGLYSVQPNPPPSGPGSGDVQYDSYGMYPDVMTDIINSSREVES